MATLKVTWMFNYASGDQRAAGWSETWYFTGTTAAASQAALRWQTSRAGMLAAPITMPGYRVQQLFDPQSNKGKSISFPSVVQGGLVQNEDIPWAGALCSVLAAGNPSNRRFILRGIPDSWIAVGDLTPDPAVPFSRFVTRLVQDGWQMRVIDVTQPLVPISTILADGTVTLQAGLALNAGDVVILHRVKDTNGRAAKGSFFVGSVTSPIQFKLNNWTGQLVTGNGTLRKRVFVYLGIVAGSGALIRAAIHKTGRPFGLSRGRVTARR